jgi:hypothetical protein
MSHPEETIDAIKAYLSNVNDGAQVEVANQ